MQTQQLDTIFSALSDSTRRAIVERLTKGEAALSELAKPFNMSQTAVSKHVKVLSDAGLVRVSKRGRVRHCQLEAAPIKHAADWLSKYQEFWLERFESLAQHLAEEDNP